MEIKNEIDKLAEMMQREFGAAQKRSEALENKMDDKIDKIDGRIDKIDNRIDGLENKMDKKFDRVDEKFNLVLNSQDEVLKRLDNLEMDNTMGAGASRRQEDKLENHEERIIVTEEKLGIREAV